MRIAFLVNRVDELSVEMSTVELIHAAAARGHDVFVGGVRDLSLASDDAVWLRGRPASSGDLGEPWLGALRGARTEPVPLDAVGLLWLRTNPARDPANATAHRAALALAEMLSARGVLVLNRPDGLLRAASKLYLTYFPRAVRPETLVSTDRDELRAYIRGRRERSVLKPLAGTHGQGVFQVAPDDANLGVMLDAVLASGPAIAQERVPGAREGDVRLILIDGDPLAVDGSVCAVRRTPGDGEFRSNIHAGGTASRGVYDEVLRGVVEAVGPRLRQDGLFLVGLDVIGGRVIEINAFAAGGLGDASRFCGVDFVGAVVEAAVRRAGAG